MNTLGTTLKIARVKNGLTVQGFVDKYNNTFEDKIDESVVQGWESNEVDLKAHTGKKIASVYGISRDELVGIQPRKVIEGVANSKVINEDEILLKNEQHVKRKETLYDHLIYPDKKRNEALRSIYHQLSNENQKAILDYAITKLYEQNR